MVEKILTPKIEALTAYANEITGKNDTTLSDAVASLADGYGGGGGGMTATGTVTGNGSNILQIPCDFEPDLIHISGDLSADVETRGIATLTIIKDMDIYYGNDSSTSGSGVSFHDIQDITGYNESDASSIHATYSSGTLSVDTAQNSGSMRWASGITYSYKLIKFG